MMRYLLLFVFSMILFNFSEGAVATAIEKFHSEYPGKCVYTADNGTVLVLDDGESASAPDECLSLSCSVLSEFFSIGMIGCGLVIAPDGCEVVKDSNWQHPQCCEFNIVCPEDIQWKR